MTCCGRRRLEPGASVHVTSTTTRSAFSGPGPPAARAPARSTCSSVESTWPLRFAARGRQGKRRHQEGAPGVPTAPLPRHPQTLHKETHARHFQQLPPRPTSPTPSPHQTRPTVRLESTGLSPRPSPSHCCLCFSLSQPASNCPPSPCQPPTAQNPASLNCPPSPWPMRGQTGWL